MNRLSKILAAAGIASRRQAEALIQEGRVRVNQRLITTPQTLVCPQRDVIQVGKQLITTWPDKVYLMLNKPRGYICSAKRVNGKKLVTDLLTSFGMRLFSVGRLDRQTSGLLLVTNDGHFAQRVIHPRANLTKEYLVKVQQEVLPQHLSALQKGVSLAGTAVRPVVVKKVRNGTLKIGVKEGKKHEIRILVAQAGLQLLALQRIRIGGLSLGALATGQWHQLSAKQQQAIFC